MLISDWMTRDVISVEQDVSMMKVSKIMKEKRIRRLPVVDAGNKLLGIVTDRDIKEASPSKATTLDIHELYYLLSEIKVKDIMTKKPFTVLPNDTIERAALVMMEKRVGGLPVVDEQGKVAGIITESDVFKVLIAITGAQFGGVLLAFKLPNTEGSLKEVLEVLRQEQTRIISILTSYGQQEEEGYRQVYVRIQDLEKNVLDALMEKLKGRFNVLYWVRENLHR
ncbi:acetoin utilization protein AcuB [Desulfonatronum thiosulfatophilum]|uniref:Acetoin utilization protein AcuB n=1 Tax=Desulfonatronum thiosulfatophilum TaxID=617002 RepID=A0A1G6A6U4_9BACT|nr:CBS and ACT domain-containing protein [Desulfonatronum thiosulfatophilum]SDB04177.1 acetoin utilization protein AcuB [Desulfonatronum thiosulfatophilum]